MKLSKELNYRIRYDVEHNLFHAQNVFDDEYIKPTFIEYVQNLEGENKLIKSFLYCTKRSCNNCGKVNCENFQRQRIDCCGLWVSYKDYIVSLEKENTELIKTHKRVCDELTNTHRNIREQLTKAKELIKNIIQVTWGEGWNYSLDVKVKAEQFLKEE